MSAPETAAPRTTAAPDPIDFSAAGVAVRRDIVDAHREAWHVLASPGTWWTGAERVAIAREVRAAPHCAHCRAAREALSPFSVEGEHTAASDLPEAAVEAVHRIVTDASRLTKSWVAGLAERGIDTGRYVELVGVVVSVMSIDRLCQGIGAPLHALPEPRDGEPSRQRPDGLEDVGAFTPMLSTRAGRKLGLWELPVAPNVIRALSFVPDEVRMLNLLGGVHYLSPELVGQLGKAPGRALDRTQIELVASRTSALNECFY